MMTGNPELLMRAKAVLRWFLEDSGLYDDYSGHIKDGFDEGKPPNPMEWSYNPGVLIRALGNLYLVERRPSFIEHITKIGNHFFDISTRDNILKELSENLNSD